MARTRAQANSGKGGGNTFTNAKGSRNASSASHAQQKTGQRRSRPAEEGEKGAQLKKSKKNDTAPTATTATTATTAISSKREPKDNKGKVEAVLSAYGVLPLQDLGLSDPSTASPETVLAYVLHAMLTSARISHDLAYQSLKILIEARYHHLDALRKSSWQERTEVLTKGGYTRYREKTATALGELAELINNEYNGDLNNLLKAADSPAQVRNHLKEIKGFGNIGVDIFHNTAQYVWPSLAPFIDPRSLKTAEQIGLGNEVNSLWEEVGKDAAEMSKLAAALTTIRLNKKEKEFAEA